MGLHRPYKDEFEVGCTIEHAADPVPRWLSAYFGLVETVTAFATCRDRRLQTDVRLERGYSRPRRVLCSKFKSGLIAWLTSSCNCTCLIIPFGHLVTLASDHGRRLDLELSRPPHPEPGHLNRPENDLGPMEEKVTDGALLPRPGVRPTEASLMIHALRRGPPPGKFGALVLHLRRRVGPRLGPAYNRDRPPGASSSCQPSPDIWLHNTDKSRRPSRFARRAGLNDGQSQPLSPRRHPFPPWALPKIAGRQAALPEALFRTGFSGRPVDSTKLTIIVKHEIVARTFTVPRVTPGIPAHAGADRSYVFGFLMALTSLAVTRLCH